jgi:ketosteroid isomerase-like protein
MKMQLVTLLGLAISLAVPSSSQEQNKVDPEVRQEIETSLNNFGEAHNKHDAAALAALFTQDAVEVWDWETGGGVVVGRPAIEKRYASEFASNSGEFVSKLIQVHAIGNEMSAISEFNFGPWKGYKVWIYVRDADEWKIHMAYTTFGRAL